MRREHWIDLGRIIIVLTAITAASVAVGKLVFGVWIDVFYPYAIGGAFLAWFRIERYRRQLRSPAEQA